MFNKRGGGSGTVKAGFSAGTGIAENSSKNCEWALNVFSKNVKNGNIYNYIKDFTKLSGLPKKNHFEASGLQKYVIARRRRFVISSDLERLIKKNVFKDVDCIIGIAGFYLRKDTGDDYSYNSTKTWFGAIIRLLNICVNNYNNVSAINAGEDGTVYQPYGMFSVGDVRCPCIRLLYSCRIQLYVICLFMFLCLFVLMMIFLSQWNSLIFQNK